MKKITILSLTALFLFSSFFTACNSVKNANNTQKGAGIGVAAGALIGGILGNNLGKGGTQMGTTLQETPSGNRLHIGIFGKTNSGKSAFINAFSGQAVSIVADVKGTTTDPVYKAMEIAPLGPCVLIDTAGFDDEGELGAMRMEKTVLAAQKTELALILFASEDMET